MRTGTRNGLADRVKGGAGDSAFQERVAARCGDPLVGGGDAPHEGARDSSCGRAKIEEEREATCVVGELHGVDDVDVHPEGLQRERRALVPDVPTVAQHSILDRTSRPQHADVPSPHDL